MGSRRLRGTGPAPASGSVAAGKDASADLTSAPAAVDAVGPDASYDTGAAADGPDAGTAACTSAADCPKPPSDCEKAFLDQDFGCIVKNLPPGAVCNDGNTCSIGDECEGGACVPGKHKTCDDDLPCTKYACNVTTGACVVVPSAGPGFVVRQTANACKPPTCARPTCSATSRRATAKRTR
ncbi:MAG: hypothetical protein EXR79_15315 [Myxococcales bacterium]|nr:hypothetical protein [Myxococcales bacterium]